MNASILAEKIEKAGFELSKVSSNDVMELFQLKANGKVFSFCQSNDEAYGFRREFENGETPSCYASAKEMLRMASRI